MNTVGLKRAGFSRDQIQRLKAAFGLLYTSGLRRQEALKTMETELADEHVLHLVAFIRSSKRGICGTNRLGHAVRERVSGG